MLKSVRLILPREASTRMLSTSSRGQRKIAVCQITSTSDKSANFEKCSQLIVEAKLNGAKMAFFPECVDFVGERKEQAFDLAEPLEGPLLSKYKDLAAKSKMWLSLGSLHVRDSDRKPEERKIHNTHVVIDDQGAIAATYDKVHLFDVDIPTFRIKESDFAFAGNSVKAPVRSPVGSVGLAICYDMRFSELALCLAKSGAQILTYPSAFTVATGYAHWETLLKARAIETQCYVVAAAQVIDPWGAVIAHASELSNHVIYADIDLDYLTKVRQGMPVWHHRRPDIYGQIKVVASPSSIDDQDTYPFGQHTLCKSQLFFRTELTMAFVNIRPILRGRNGSDVLVSPVRVACRLNELTAAERADLISVVRKVQAVVESEFVTDSSSINIQDGALAGRSVDHLHVHILPRRAGDFKHDNDVYAELQDPAPKQPLRTAVEMAEEATRLRTYFY